MNARSRTLRLAIFGLLLARAPRWAQRVLAFMALGALLAVALIALAVSARARTSGGTTKPPACYPVSVHITKNTFGCPDVRTLDDLFRNWTKKGIERASEKTFNRLMDELGKRGCFSFKKGAGPFDAVDLDDDITESKMVQLVVFWRGRHRMMWFVADAIYIDDPNLAAQCAEDTLAAALAVHRPLSDLPDIVTFDHDWSTGCSEQAGIEGWFAEQRARKYKLPDDLERVLETHDCTIFKKEDVPQFKLMEVSKERGYCKVMPMYPATDNTDDKIHTPLWFSCRAFFHIPMERRSPLR
jgi:hypothetical protein